MSYKLAPGSLAWHDPAMPRSSISLFRRVEKALETIALGSTPLETIHAAADFIAENFAADSEQTEKLRAGVEATIRNQRHAERTADNRERLREGTEVQIHAESLDPAGDAGRGDDTAVATVDGEPITGKQSVVRYLGYIPGALVFGLGYLWMLWDDKKQTWHDKVVGSIVVKV